MKPEDGMFRNDDMLFALADFPHGVGGEDHDGCLETVKIPLEFLAHLSSPRHPNTLWAGVWTFPEAQGF